MHSLNFLVSIQTSRSDSCARRDAPATQWKQNVAVTHTARRPVILRDLRNSSTIGLRRSERDLELLDISATRLFPGFEETSAHLCISCDLLDLSCHGKSLERKEAIEESP